ncbi:RraA family protein [Pusillimonas sp. SM2304]|uniref:RraA family protein n=1 Tax=Pusillimonas sp. SM2304 TaxID=3073241 RepID=UPI002874BE2F|nr:RraA family protein [Pusillimonas sp. SM2304]MDS1140770.1 RraA family protein [Pusillimonas sp. SM2304]
MINSHYQRVDEATLAACAGLPASILADVCGRRGALDGQIGAIHTGKRLCGTAFTVDVRPGDNLMIHAALMLAGPGDVLVIDGKASTTCALMGELMCAHAQQAGLAGIVIDGAVRDVDALRQGALPVYARAANPNGPTRIHGGRIGYPVSVGGVCVEPGDLVVGDDDGVVVVSKHEAPAVLDAARRKVEAEAQRMRDIQAGRLLYGWLEGALKTAGELPEERSLEALMKEFRSAQG